jgi:hypothetical protein
MLHDYLKVGNIKKIEESNEKKKIRILHVHNMHQGMIVNENDASLSSVDHTKKGFLAAADLNAAADADEETAEIVAGQDASFQEHFEEPYFHALLRSVVKILFVRSDCNVYVINRSHNE